MKTIATVILTILLTSCTHEMNYRGIPETQWKKLSPEQKQLIVDQSYEEEVNGRN